MTITPEFIADPPEPAASAPVDVLSETLGGMSLRGEVFCRTTLGPDAGLSFPSGQAHFHVIERGPCWVSVPSQQVVLRVGPGDLLLLVGATGHTVASAAKEIRDHALWDVVPTHYDPAALTLDLSDGEPWVEMICGRFSIDAVGSERLIGALPPVLHLPVRASPLGDWLASTLTLLSAEATSQRPGSALTRARLVELVLVGAIRRWLEDGGEARVGWLSALRDPHVGKALGLLHARPAHPWTVPELAAATGLSRSPFAARFKDAVGSAPLRYLTAWRMRLASRLLRGGASVGEAAAAVGYASDAAFSRSFKKEMGVPPSALRPRSPVA